MAKHLESVTWGFRKNNKKNHINGFVKTASKKEIAISLDHRDGFFTFFNLSRRDARLLAKRINQCLDYTL